MARVLITGASSMFAEAEEVGGGVSFDYGKLQVPYTPQKPDGSSL